MLARVGRARTHLIHNEKELTTSEARGAVTNGRNDEVILSPNGHRRRDGGVVLTKEG